MQNLYSQLVRIVLFGSGIIFLVSFGLAFNLKNAEAMAISASIIFGAALVATAIFERKGTDAK
jgi:hypothetical protein